VGIARGDPFDIVMGGGFLVIDFFTWGIAGKVKAATVGVSKLARMVQKGGKIVKGVLVGGKEFKCLRLAAMETAKLKKLLTLFEDTSSFLSNII
jgi:hypothetical protein